MDRRKEIFEQIDRTGHILMKLMNDDKQNMILAYVDTDDSQDDCLTYIHGDAPALLSLISLLIYKLAKQMKRDEIDLTSYILSCMLERKSNNASND